ncbi:zinc ABC transporter permease AztB [Zhihengliuella halotolerans]|uniref:zinc ABC transporter permease AztB n=1 Tax=Zhihengliuella halotolerans TaxID=370736 RepID=UPI002155E313|nr:zinc ABC transporter permease AztB [Zhihengliuella halotolerans]
MLWLTDPFSASFMVNALLGGSLVAATCGVVGTWVVIRGMAFLGEAIGHGMLPGVALATVLGLPALLGGAVSAAAMSATIGLLQRRGRLSYDTSIGLLFVGMLSLGIIIVSHSRSFATDATVMLFGDILAINRTDLTMLAIAFAVTATIAAVFHRSFVAAAFDVRVAATLGLRPRLAQVMLVALVTLAVVASYQAVGSLLVVGLLLAPAVAAGRWTRRIGPTMLAASAFGVASVIGGLLVSWHFGTAAGSSIAATAILFAALSALARGGYDHLQIRWATHAEERPAAPRQSKPRARQLAATAAAVGILATGCAPVGGAPDASAPTGSAAASEADGHGAIEGAEEVSEPPLHLVTSDADGRVGLLDLLTEESSQLGEVDAPLAAATDGRYLFLTTEAGLEIVDSGAWTWDHTDHFHYYRQPPRVAGLVPGEGDAVVGTPTLPTAGSTGVFFSGSSEAVLLDNHALSQGRIKETFRLDLEPHDGLVAPVGAGALITVPDAASNVQRVQYYDDDGDPVDGLAADCPAASGTITTRVGVAIGCADGAVLATGAEGGPELTVIPYPNDAGAPPATEFSGRKGRPTVAGLAGESGEAKDIWLLDTRAESWSLVEADRELAAVTAVDDADGHVVALAADGSVRVYSAETGEELGATEPLVDAPVDSVQIVADAQRAYVSDPAAGVVHEIAYASEVRVARSLETPTTPDYFAETGR